MNATDDGQLTAVPKRRVISMTEAIRLGLLIPAGRRRAPKVSPGRSPTPRLHAAKLGRHAAETLSSSFGIDVHIRPCPGWLLGPLAEA